MSIQENVRVVKDAFAAMGGVDKRGLLSLTAEDIEWIIPGEDWRIYFGTFPKRWNFHTQSHPNS